MNRSVLGISFLSFFLLTDIHSPVQIDHGRVLTQNLVHPLQMNFVSELIGIRLKRIHVIYIPAFTSHKPHN